MNLVDLILLVCSLSNPSACGERHVLLQSSGSLQACMMQAPPFLAQWVEEHPNYGVQRWRCAWPGADGAPT